jgi:hypothetical protein
MVEERPHVSILTGKNLSARRKQIGALAPAESSPAAATDVDPDTNIPIRHILSSSSGSAAQPDGHPGVSISSSGPASGGGHSKTKWIAILAVAGGAGAALAFVHKGKSSSASSSTSIGTPTVSLGHP